MKTINKELIMKITANQNDKTLENVKKIIITIGGNTYHISELNGVNMVIQKISDINQNQIIVYPKCSNLIYIS
jgi:glutamine amidotransferase PdxT